MDGGLPGRVAFHWEGAVATHHPVPVAAGLGPVPEGEGCSPPRGLGERWP